MASHFFRIILTSALCFFAGLGMTRAGDPRVLTFDPPDLPDAPGNFIPSLQEQNFEIGTIKGVYVQSAYLSGYADNGTFYGTISYAGFYIQHAYGSLFTLKSIDLAEYSADFNTPTTVTFTGCKVGGGTVTQTFTTDGVMDGNGPKADFQTFTFSSDFTNLTRVQANGVPFMVDNIVVSVDGTEATGTPVLEPSLVYNVTWDSPKHTVGKVTSVGGPLAPTSVVFGTPTVRSQVGTLTGPALEFKGSGYQQIEWELHKNASVYRLEFDAYNGLPIPFKVFFDREDAPTGFDINNDGTITEFQSSGSPIAIGTYPRQQTAHIAISMSRETGLWEVDVDGAKQFSGPLEAGNWDLRDIRFHAGDSSLGSAGVDNVKIYAEGRFADTHFNPTIATTGGGFTFPDIYINDTITRNVTLKNLGAQTLHIQSITTASGSQFISQENNPITIPPGGDYYPAVEFAPHTAGTITGSLTITSDDPATPTLDVPLSGLSIGIPAISITPNPVAVKMLKGSSGSIPLTLANPGSAPLSWSVGIYTYNDSANQKHWVKPASPPPSGTLAPGESTQVPLKIKTVGLAAGSHQQSLLVQSNDDANPFAIVPVDLDFLPGNAYNKWLFRHFASHHVVLADDETDVWGDTADPDQDGLNNLLEYLLGADPQSQQPDLEPATIQVNGESVFEFPLRAQHPGVAYHVEWSPSLDPANWQSTGLIATGGNKKGLPPGVQRVRVKLKTPQSPVYFRIVVSRN